MSIMFRTYNPEPLFGEDYQKLRAFLLALGNPNWLSGRFDWMITHSMLDTEGLPRMGLWEEDGALIAAAVHDIFLGNGYLLALPGYECLREEMLRYAKTAMSKDGNFCVLIPQGDKALEGIAKGQGFRKILDMEHDSVYPIGDPDAIAYALPEGFSVTSLADTPDWEKYGRVLWKGFNHERDGQGPFQFTEEKRKSLERALLRPNVDLSLKIAVAAPGGEFVSYCGMWYDPACESALVEPVATDPDYRRRGLGRAAVLEGVRRCGLLGAKRAFVGSNQKFYYKIGFQPYAKSVWWKL